MSKWSARGGEGGQFGQISRVRGHKPIRRGERPAHVHQLHEHMEELARIGAHIDAFEYCPNHPEAVIERYRRVSYRRKPAPGMILDLLKRFSVYVSRSFLIGDEPADLEAAEAAGVRAT